MTGVQTCALPIFGLSRRAKTEDGSETREGRPSLSVRPLLGVRSLVVKLKTRSRDGVASTGNEIGKAVGTGNAGIKAAVARRSPSASVAR